MLKTSKLGCLVVSLLAATALQTFASEELTASRSASKPSPLPSTKSTAKPAKSTAKPAVRYADGKSPLTISLKSGMRRGNLVVALDGVPIFNEEFQKPALVISQTTTWDPVQVAAGKHQLTAMVYGTKGKAYISAVYDLELSRANPNALLIRLKGEKLTVVPAS